MKFTEEDSHHFLRGRVLDQQKEINWLIERNQNLDRCCKELREENESLKERVDDALQALEP